MTPSPQEHTQAHKDGIPRSIADAKRVVVSGMSGLYPQSRYIRDFSNVLYNKVNPVTMEDCRWDFKHPELCNYTGKISGLERFDAQFFKVHYWQGHTMDPMSRKLLELAYEAIYDAGLNPTQFDGKKVGVYIASGLSETECVGFLDVKSKHGFGITGCSKTMYANRISYWLNTKGPSVTIDGDSCGSGIVLEQAFQALNRGDCEAALVGGANICLLPQTMVNFRRCISIAPDGKTKSFSEDADGCTKSDAISVLFLQKATDARRIYGEVINVKNEFISKMSDETGQVFGFKRNLNSNTAFLKQFYEETKVLPEAVEYVEGFGSASLEADKMELQAIEKVFCANRTEPLRVGSVMSNIGFTDSASGCCAIIKVLLGYHNGLIAGNLHCENPRTDVAALKDGRMQLVRENQPLRGTYTAVNGLSLTGINSHVLLHGHIKPKDYSRYPSTIPRLVVLSSRQESTLSKIFEDFKSRPIDPEEIALLHNIHTENIPGHLGRGYIILDTDNEQKTRSLGEKAEYFNDAKQPLWFVYSGMGSQWTGMGAQLMRLPIFAAAIERCHQVLKPKGIDIVHIITSPDKTVFDNILNSFVGIAAVQIGLTDILIALGLQPDNYIGHSVGELACAYADGCLTAEEMILAAYSRGKVSLETKLIRGAMAAVGLGYEKISKLCPAEIQVACHNGPESCTISGPAEYVAEFVKRLTASGVFAKEVPCSNIAYHSQYIAPAGPKLFEYLSEVIVNPKRRSKRWLSTSVPAKNWHEQSAKMCSAEYLTNNLLSPVLFEETSNWIPKNAVLVEIAPHGLLQAILKRSLPGCKNISLTKRGHEDNAVFLLNAIGQLFIEGYTPKIQELYPKVEFPVSTGTPHLSHYVEWMHTEKWNLSAFVNTSIVKAASCNFSINTQEKDYDYLRGNIIRGNVLYPFAAALVAVWDTLAMTLGEKKKNVSVQFSEVHLHSQPVLHEHRQLKLNVSIHKGNGRFHVLNEMSKVASGFITVVEPNSWEHLSDWNELEIGAEEVYKSLSCRGYSYNDKFKSIHKLNETITEAELLWNDNWVVLLDAMIQLNVLRHPYTGMAQPSQIRNLTINVKQHNEIKYELFNDNKLVKAKIDPILDLSSCGGIVLNNIKFRNMSIEIPDPIKFELSTPEDDSITKNAVQNIEASLDEKPLVLQIRSIGDINTLHWEETANVFSTGVKVKVQCSGLNISDMKRAAGLIPFDGNEKLFGMDFSGLTDRGDRVMGLVKNGSASTIVHADPNFIWPIPAHWSFEDAATVPLAYVQAFYCLFIKNKLEKNSRVLIHGGAGALGQAAISIALAKGCQVFTTVADQSKKKFLQKLFPQLQEGYIGYSRHDSFGDIVLNATNGEGCNIILSCVKGELRNTNLKCTSYSGITVDTSLLQDSENFTYGMSYMTKSRSFMTVDLNSIFDPNNFEIIRHLQNLVSDGIISGFVRPLSRVLYAPNEVPRAFRLLAASRHRGRVLLRLQDQPLPAQSRISCTPNYCQIIFCDDKHTGVQMADRLVARGATNLWINFPDSSSHYRLKVRFWRDQGVKVKVSFEKLTSYSEIYKLIETASVQAQVEGIYIMTTDESTSLNDKTSFVNRIDGASRVLCPLLKYFAVASINSNVGADACLSRSIDSLSALTINLPDPDFINKQKQNDSTIDNMLWHRIAVDAIERGLHCTYPVLIAKPQEVKQLSLLQQIVNIAGISNLFQSDDYTTLGDLGVENEELTIIQSYLNDTLNMNLEKNDIVTLTKNKIQKLEEYTKEKHFKDTKGLSTFFEYVDSDELRGTTDLMIMETLVNAVIGIEIDLKDSYLCIVPGMEGNHKRFRSLCEVLKLPAVVLQPGLDFVNETPKDLALRYSKVLLNKLGVKESFYLLGYEYGVIIALELAVILEANGHTGTVYLIGDDPRAIQAQINEQLADFSTEDAMQEGIIDHMSKLMSETDSSLLQKAMLGCSSWEERVTACVNVLQGRSLHTAQYIRAVLEAAYAHIRTSKTCLITPQKLKSKIVLLRAKSSKVTTEDSNLQQFSEQPVVVHDLNTSLAHAANDLRCAVIINKYLSKDILDVFTESNLCDSYAVCK